MKKLVFKPSIKFCFIGSLDLLGFKFSVDFDNLSPVFCYTNNQGRLSIGIKEKDYKSLSNFNEVDFLNAFTVEDILFPELTRQELDDSLSKTLIGELIVWYYIDANGFEYCQNSDSKVNDFNYPMYHKSDIYCDTTSICLPSGTLEKLGIKLDKFQVIGVETVSGQYVLSYTCSEKQN